MSFKRIRSNPNYGVSQDGEVKNLRTDRILRPSIKKEGYKEVRLAPDYRGKKVHRLVAQAFVPNPDHKDFVVHKDGDNGNNRANNLRWVDRSTYQTELYLYCGKNHNTKTSPKPVRINETGEMFSSMMKCALYLGVSRSSIRQQLTGQIKTCKGYTFSLI